MRVIRWGVVIVLVVGIWGCAHTAPSPPISPKTLQGMVWVPPGPFLMGHDRADGQLGVEVGVDSIPRYTVELDGFWIDQLEATVADYKAFVEGTTGHAVPYWILPKHPLQDRWPVGGISFFEASDYCKWRGKVLPTEAQWEKAARGTDGRIYPWGNDWQPSYVSYNSPFRETPDEVGSHPENISPYGVLDMSGSVQEWTSSWYTAPPESTLKRQAFGEKFHVLKGGGWISSLAYLRAANRYAVISTLNQPDFGVRCVVNGQ